MPRASERVRELETLTRDPGLCRIHLSRRVIGPLRRDDAARLGIGPGTRWTKPLAAKVALLVDAAEARRLALSWLGRGPRSAVTLRGRLLRRGIPEAAVDRALSELREDGWLDDARSAQERGRSLRRREPLSRAALDARLRGEGYGAQARRAVLDSMDGDDHQSATALARERLARGDAPGAVVRRLARRGFEVDIILAALRACGAAMDEDE